MELSVYLLVVLYNLHSNVMTEALNALTETTAQLKCSFKTDADLGERLQWLKSNLILSENALIGNSIMKDRLTITGDHSKGEYHLNISNIRENDMGAYKCLLTKTLETETHQLIVIVGPTSVAIENVTPDNTILGIEGQDLTIKCTAVGGQPPPDVKLVILGSTYSGKQSAQHKFKPSSGNDGSNVICQAGYKEFEHYPLTTSSNIHLKFKPVLTPFDPDTLYTEETKSFDVSCQSTGSRPAASMYWLLGQQHITSNSTSQTIHDSSTDKYTMISSLRYSVDRRYNGHKLTCGAVNIAGAMETFLTLDVKYAPGVTVENKTFSLTQSHRQIDSTLDSNPPINICTWQHKSTYGEIIRDFSDNNQTLTLPTVSENKRYQDTGEYVCIAENGIVGKNGQLKHMGSGYAISNASPVITVDNKYHYTQYGKFGKSTEIKVNVYSIPKFTHKSWYKGNKQLVSSKYIIKEDPAIVKDLFHGVEVQLDGYTVKLAISDLQESDFTNYTLRIYYGSQYAQHDVTLESASAPETPSNFSITSSRETSIKVQWIPGYDGGQKQTFYLQYCISGTNTWVHKEIKTDNKPGKQNFYTLSGLQEKTTYELRMYAQNAFSQSPKTDTETTTTQQSVFTEAQTSPNVITGAVAGVLVVLLIVCAITISIVVFKKRKCMKKAKKDTGFYENSGFKNVQIGDEYEEVVSKSDTQQNQTSKTYESLGTKNAVDVYDDLDNRKGLPSSKPSVDHYEALSAKDKPTFYEELENRQGQTEKVYVNEAF